MSAIRPNLNFDNETAVHVPYTASIYSELTWEHVRQPKQAHSLEKKPKTQKPGPAIDPTAYKKWFDKFG
jgi:hypothetical protein